MSTTSKPKVEPGKAEISIEQEIQKLEAAKQKLWESHAATQKQLSTIVAQINATDGAINFAKYLQENK